MRDLALRGPVWRTRPLWHPYKPGLEGPGLEAPGLEDAPSGTPTNSLEGPGLEAPGLEDAPSGTPTSVQLTTYDAYTKSDARTMATGHPHREDRPSVLHAFTTTVPAAASPARWRMGDRAIWL